MAATRAHRSVRVFCIRLKDQIRRTGRRPAPRGIDDRVEQFRPTALA